METDVFSGIGTQTIFWLLGIIGFGAAAAATIYIIKRNHI